MIFDIASVEEKIGYSFNDKMLLRKCFTHSSYANEHGIDDNELLEFFGDAIIEFIVSEYLYKNPLGREGVLTNERQKIVSKEPLLNAIKKLDIAKYMLLGKGQNKESSGEEKLFSSLYESLVAGIYLDGGIIKVKKFILDTLILEYQRELKKEEKIKKSIKKDNYKGILQEYVMKGKMGSISYETLSKKGPDHHPEFRVAVLLNGERIVEAVGQSKKLAEMDGAKIALQKLKKDKNNRW